ncbi:MAG: potassium transporter TrkA [Euryarchaeota archaeon]|nr:potassium transporter TrkA [Euryarchaeota archaeon]
MGGFVKLFKRRKEQYLTSDRDPDEEEHEEIEYEPVSVRELLTEMKDISELIIDLAYSALVLDSSDIAEEVEDLETRMETLNYHIRLQCMMASRTRDDAEMLSGILQVASAAEKIGDAAADIAKIIQGRARLGPFLPKLLAEADETLGRMHVDPKSKAVGMSLGEASVETETGNRIIAVRRGKSWTYGPGRRFILKANDSLIVRGRADGAEYLKRWLAGEEDEL